MLMLFSLQSFCLLMIFTMLKHRMEVKSQWEKSVFLLFNYIPHNLCIFVKHYMEL